jgi:hypothetical protein
MTINNKARENVRPSMKRLAESAGGSRPSPDADANAAGADALQQQRLQNHLLRSSGYFNARRW